MKKFCAMFVGLLLAASCFLGCDLETDDSTEDTSLFTAECGIISREFYESNIEPKFSNWESSYSGCASLRSYLYKNTDFNYPYDFLTDVTMDEIREYLLPRMDRSEVEKTIRGLEEVGNCIVFFDTIYGHDEVMWAYAKKY